MQARTVKRGRPLGAKTVDPVLAVAFGQAVRAVRLRQGVAQESLAHLAAIERSHMGKIERGEHLPTLAIVMKLARALGVSGAALVAEAEALLPVGYPAPP